MDLYRKYLEEREEAHLLDYEWGFAVYKYGKDYVYLQDIYVVPEQRQNKLGIHLMNEVAKEAKERGCVNMIGSVKPSAPFAKEMHEIMYKVGFKLFKSEKDFVYYIKEI